MFKRGGNVSARNNGIVQGFDNGGSVVDDLRAAGLIRDLERPTGLSTADYLRIAAAGAQIMGAQPTGRSGFVGALQAASPALTGLGVDLASSQAARQADFESRQAAQDQLIASGIIADRDKLEKQFILEEAPKLRAQLAAATTPAEQQAIIDQLDALFPEKAKAKFDELQEARTQGFYDFLDDAEKIVRKLQDGTASEEQIRLYSGKSSTTIAKELAIANVLGDYRYMAEGGRIGFSDGGRGDLKYAVESFIRDFPEFENLEGKKLYKEMEKRGYLSDRDEMNKGGKVQMAMSDPSPEAERSDMLEDMALKRFGKPLSSLTDVQVIELEEDLQELIREKMSEGGSTRAGDNEEKAAEDRMKMESDKFYIDKDGNLRKIPTKKPRQNTRPGMNEEIAADAARRAELNKRYGRAEGGAMPAAPKDSPLTFEELRARLPREVTDQVVRLLATSESALLDFANIDTEQDIAIFNQKYNADLQLPTQVA